MYNDPIGIRQRNNIESSPCATSFRDALGRSVRSDGTDGTQVPSSAAPAVIGTKGSQIKEAMERSTGDLRRFGVVKHSFFSGK